MVLKTSAHYQREYRRRLREQGLIKKEIWIRPEHTDKARALETELRLGKDGKGARPDNDSRPHWRTEELYSGLNKAPLICSNNASIELIDGVDPTILVVMHEYGDLPVYVTVAGDQVIVEAVLWPTSEIEDTAYFNETVLRTHKYFPLSTISLGQRAHDDYYLMFGSLNASSDLTDIVHEIEVLASNVIHATEAYADMLIPTHEYRGERS
ncbi:MAG: YjfI family protein [Gammaproteobacteria bacterium]|nr:YjfI family protein [Gammaproteobacteria bacterium]